MVRILGKKLTVSEKFKGTNQHFGYVRACNWERLLHVIKVICPRYLVLGENASLAMALESLASAI